MLVVMMMVLVGVLLVEFALFIVMPMHPVPMFPMAGHPNPPITPVPVSGTIIVRLIANIDV